METYFRLDISRFESVLHTAQETSNIKLRSHFELTTEHPYLALTGELWVLPELRGEKWPQDIGSALWRADLNISWAKLQTLVTKRSADDIDMWITQGK